MRLCVKEVDYIMDDEVGVLIQTTSINEKLTKVVKVECMVRKISRKEIVKRLRKLCPKEPV